MKTSATFSSAHGPHADLLFELRDVARRDAIMPLHGQLVVFQRFVVLLAEF